MTQINSETVAGIISNRIVVAKQVMASALAEVEVARAVLEELEEMECQFDRLARLETDGEKPCDS